MTTDEMREEATALKCSAPDSFHGTREGKTELRNRAALYDIGAGIIDALEKIAVELQSANRRDGGH